MAYGAETHDGAEAEFIKGHFVDAQIKRKKREKIAEKARKAFPYVEIFCRTDWLCV